MNKVYKKKIRESFIRKKKFRFYLIFVFSFSMLLISLFSGALHFSGNYLKKYAKDMYGKYHYSISGLDKESAETISKDKKCHTSSIYQGIITDEYFMISCDDNYIDLAGADILEGEFPKDSNHILCNKNYLFQLGYSDDEMFEASVTINDNEYKVSGIVDLKTFDELEFNGALIIYNSKFYEFNLQYGVLIQGKSDNFKNDIIYIKNKYNLESYQIYENRSYLNLACRTIGDFPSGFLGMAYIIVLIINITLIMLTFSIIILSNHQIKKIISVYKKLGINDKCIAKSYIELMIKMISIVFVIVNAIAAIFICFVEPNQSIKFIIKNMLYQSIIYIIPVIIFAVKSFKKLIAVESCSKIHINSKKFNNTNKLVSGKNVFIQIARKNNIYGKARYIAILLPLIFSGTLFVCTLFFTKQLTSKHIETNDFNYALTYSGNDWDKDSIKEYNEVISKLEGQIKKFENSYIVPIYVKYNEKVVIDKKNLSNKYKNIISKENLDVKKQLNQAQSKVLSVPACFIGIRKEDYDSYGLSEEDVSNLQNDECIVINNVKLSDNSSVNAGISKGDVIKLLYNDEDDNLVNDNLKVKSTYPDVDINLSDDNAMIKIIVNKEKMKNITFYMYPQIVYVKCEKADSEEMMKIMKGNKMVDFTDIEDSNRKYMILNNIIDYIAIFIIITIFVFTIINIWLILKIRFKDIKKQCITLKTIGVSDNKTILVFVFDIIKLFLQGLVTTIIISLILCYLLMSQRAVSIRVYLLYYAPYIYFIFLYAFYVICSAFFIYFLKHSLKKMNVIQEMKCIE